MIYDYYRVAGSHWILNFIPYYLQNYLRSKRRLDHEWRSWKHWSEHHVHSTVDWWVRNDDVSIQGWRAYLRHRSGARRTDLVHTRIQNFRFFLSILFFFSLPRYSCAKFGKVSESVLQYKLSKINLKKYSKFEWSVMNTKEENRCVLTGQFATIDSADICDSSNFEDDEAPLFDVYRSASMKTLIGWFYSPHDDVI